MTQTPTSTDLVVVGSGTGLMAAITAAEAGLRVLVLEKSDHLGGSTALSGGGIWVPGNSVLADADARDDTARALTYLDALVGDSAPRERRVSFVAHGPAAIDTMRRLLPNRWAHCRGYADYRPDLPGGSALGRTIESDPFDLALLGDDRPHLRPPSLTSPVPMPITARDYRWMNLARRHPRGVLAVGRRLGQGLLGQVRGKEFAAGGQALAAGLLVAARRLGVEIRRNTAVRDLVVENGRVCGVQISTGGDAVGEIRASRGVILASGGFDHAAAVRTAQQPQIDGSWSLGADSNTGDILDIARRHGAALTLMDQAWWFPAIAPVGDGEPGILLAERSLPGQIIVDGTGRRFVNEALNYMEFGRIMLGQDGGEPHLPAWMVFDQTYRDSYVFGGVAFPGMPLPKSWYEAGVAVRADSLEDLAARIDAPGLPDEVRHFNAMAVHGRDDDFGRGENAYDRYYGDPTHAPNPSLRPLDRGPFYAVRIVPGDLGTCGGLLADDRGRVLTEDGSVVEGLYAIGNAAGNAFGHSYPGAGATIGQGLVFGHIAALHAADRS